MKFNAPLIVNYVYESTKIELFKIKARKLLNEKKESNSKICSKS